LKENSKLYAELTSKLIGQSHSYICFVPRGQASGGDVKKEGEMHCPPPSSDPRDPNLGFSTEQLGRVDDDYVGKIHTRKTMSLSRTIPPLNYAVPKTSPSSVLAKA
jgi:hypothetical protein